MKINNKMFKKFLKVINDYGEFVFGSDKEVKKQLELCLNNQGYWSGCSIRIYYDKNIEDFYVESRF